MYFYKSILAIVVLVNTIILIMFLKKGQYFYIPLVILNYYNLFMTNKCLKNKNKN